MQIRTLVLLACTALILPAYGAHAQGTAMSDQCKALIKQYWNTMHVVIDSGTLQTKADDKPDTLQVVLIKGLAKDQSKVSADGQVIYQSPDDMSDKKQLSHLIFTALERRIAKGSGVSCQGIEAFLNGR